MDSCKTIITHWFPILTFCPVNNLPDFIFIEVEFDSFVELYSVRKKLKKEFQFKNMYMEDVALKTSNLFPSAKRVKVRLAFNKHQVIME